MGRGTDQCRLHRVMVKQLLISISLSLSAFGQAFTFADVAGAANFTAAAAGGAAPTVTLVGADVVNDDAQGTSVATDTGINVSSGDVIIVIGGGASDVDITCASSPSVGTFTEVRDSWDSGNAYKTAIFRLVATSSQTGVIFTLTFGSSSLFRAVGAAVFNTSSGTFAFDNTTSQGTAGILNSTSTSRTSANMTTAVADSLLVGLGMDWDGTTHTGANSYAIAFDGTTPFLLWKQVASTGSHPGGNFSTVNPTDKYFGDFIAYSINP